MNIVRLSLASLRYNRVGNIFNILVLAFGVAIIVTVAHISDQVQRRFDRDLAGFDLVIGAKGSPVQLILSTIFHLDMPVGNIDLEEAKKIEKNSLVASSIPIALGDNYQGFRVVGTTPDYPQHYGAKLASGAYWNQNMQAVIGSDVARAMHLKVGQTLKAERGIIDGDGQAEFPYEVTGILAPTDSVIDRLVLTSVPGTWHPQPHSVRHHHSGHKDTDEEEVVHEDKQITALLLTYKSPLAAAVLPQLVNHSNTMQAASPAFEMLHLSRMLGVGGEAIRIFGAALVIIAAIGFFMALFNAVSDRQYDIALLRVLGATRSKVFAYVMMEGMALGIAGTLSGLVLGHILTFCIRHWIEATQHITLAGSWFNGYELMGALAAVASSVLASAIPAFMAYRVNVAEAISRGA
ncbi:MAG TPA: ABC transporter permease [Rickettsiales bacterium]|nr:ABC transporter permease [Rickettsiales bacterium]